MKSLMVKIGIVVAAIGILWGCGGNASKVKNAFSCEGTYIGTIPTADGAGMTVSITLENDAYIKKVEYIGKEGVYEDKGKYALNKEGDTVTLEGITDSPNKYLVTENSLIQLDLEGKRITGDMADLYVLKKDLTK